MSLPRKSTCAFLMNAERLWQKGFRVYFWTFTFNVCHSDWESAELWRDFLHHLRISLGGDWSGVRVSEIHPGGHGTHFHALINRRLNVNVVRRIAKCHGFGRIFVEVADQNLTPSGESAAALYLSKYLSKSRSGPVGKTGRSTRRWAAFGPMPKTRVKDLVNESPMWLFRRAEKLPFLGYMPEHWLARCWDLGEDTFRTAWFSARQHSEDKKYHDLIGLANGSLVAAGSGRIVERVRWHEVAGPF